LNNFCNFLGWFPGCRDATKYSWGLTGISWRNVGGQQTGERHAKCGGKKRGEKSKPKLSTYSTGLEKERQGGRRDNGRGKGNKKDGNVSRRKSKKGPKEEGIKYPQPRSKKEQGSTGKKARPRRSLKGNWNQKPKTRHHEKQIHR